MTPATIFRVKKKQGVGNIDTGMSVSLLEAAWPHLRSKFAGAVRPAKPPKRPSRSLAGALFIQSLLAFENINRVLGNIRTQIRVFLSEDPRTCAASTTWRDSKMTNGAAAILSMIVTPVFAQAAIDEPGAFAFYHP